MDLAAITEIPSRLGWNGPLHHACLGWRRLCCGLLVARLPLLDGVLLVAGIIGVVTVIEPLAGLAAALFLGPLRAYLRAEVPQVPAQIGQIFVALALAVWLARGLAPSRMCAGSRQSRIIVALLHVRRRRPAVSVGAVELPVLWPARARQVGYRFAVLPPGRATR